MSISLCHVNGRPHCGSSISTRAMWTTASRGDLGHSDRLVCRVSDIGFATVAPRKRIFGSLVLLQLFIERASEFISPALACTGHWVCCGRSSNARFQIYGNCRMSRCKCSFCLSRRVREPCFAHVSLDGISSICGLLFCHEHPGPRLFPIISKAFGLVVGSVGGCNTCAPQCRRHSTHVRTHMHECGGLAFDAACHVRMHAMACNLSLHISTCTTSIYSHTMIICIYIRYHLNLNISICA